LPAWVQARAQSRQLRLAPAAVQLIADRAEGNLLAAAQEIEKLMLFQSADPLDDEALRAAVMDNARYDPFDAVDAAFGGDASRAVRILRGLAAAGTEPVPVIWAFDREVRTAAGCAEAVAQGQSVERVLERAQVWPKRRALVCGAIRRHPPRAWLGILRLCSRLDRVAKGAAPGDPWTELQWLSLALAGRGKAGLARVFLD
jgi:DNA polymerase-3 subunit delta